MKSFSRFVAEGEELALPPADGASVFAIVAVDVTTSDERGLGEMKDAFKSWDSNKLGAIQRQDLDRILRELCPALDAEGRKMLLDQADRGGTGVIGYEDLIDRVLVG